MGVGNIIGKIIGVVLVGAIALLIVPLLGLMLVVEGLMLVINWLGDKIQKVFSAVVEALENSWFGSGGEEEGGGAASIYDGAPTLQVSVAREPINIQELRQDAQNETAAQNRKLQDQLTAMNAKLSATLTEAKDQRNTLEVANEQRETANAQRAEGQPSPETRPRDRSGRSPG